MKHITAKDEAAKDRLMKGLDGFLERGSGPRSVRPGPKAGFQPENRPLRAENEFVAPGTGVS